MAGQPNQPPAATGGGWRSRFLPALAGAWLAAVTVAVYWPALGCDFINYDDPDYVTANPQVRAGLTWAGLRWAFTTIHSSNWHPLTWLSHMLDAQWFGLNAPASHGVNVLFHAANTVLVFLCLRRLTRTLWRSLLVAALFGWHPLHVESVAWVAERKDVLSTFFGLLSLIFYARYAEERKHPTSNIQSRTINVRGWYWLALVALALGLMSKPMLVTWPFVMLLLDFWPLGRFTICDLRFANSRSISSLVARHSSLLLEKVPFFSLAAASAVITYFAQMRSGSGEALATVSLVDRLANAGVAYILYLGKAIWPADLAVIYPHPGHWPWVPVAGAVGLLVLVSGMVFRSRRAHPYGLMGWLWFLGTLLPVIGLVQVGEQSMADRYSYVPLLGMFIVVVWGVGEAVIRWRWSKVLALGGAGLVCGVLSWRTVEQLRHWRNSETLFRQALAATRNNPVAHGQLGTHLLAAGRTDEAIQHFRRAVQLKPDNPGMLTNLGSALANQGRGEEAVMCYRQALQQDKNFAPAMNNLGVMLARLGRGDEAVEQYRRAVESQPDYAEAWFNLGNALASQGKLDAAVESYLRGLQLDPDDAQARYNLGNARAGQGRMAAAIGDYRRALRINPGYVEARYNLGCLLARQGLRDEAKWQLTEVLRLSPDYAPAREQLNRLNAAP